MNWMKSVFSMYSEGKVISMPVSVLILWLRPAFWARKSMTFLCMNVNHGRLIRILHALENLDEFFDEIADYLDVTEEYLEDCIDCYRDKYGIYKEIDNYVIYFIPHLIVFKKF